MKRPTSTDDQEMHNVHNTIGVMLDIADALNRTTSLHQFYQAIHRSLSAILNVDNFYIAVHHPDEDKLIFPYYTNQNQHTLTVVEDISQTASLTALVVKTGKPMMLTREEICRHIDTKRLPTMGEPCRMWLGVPLTVKGNVMGVLSVQSYDDEGLYRESDLNILNIVAEYIALAIERKETDEAYKKQRKILEKILQTSPIGIALLENRVFKWVNPEMVTLFGYKDKSDFEEASVAMIYESSEEFMEMGERIHSGVSHSGRYEFETTLKRKDGSTFPANINISAANPSDPMSWIIATFTDLSGKKQAETERNKNEKLQGVLEMAGAVCHEMNQPLQALVGYAELIIMDHGDNPEDRQLTQDILAIKEHVDRITKITRCLSSITSYRTVDYPGVQRIVDIWNASKDKKPSNL